LSSVDDLRALWRRTRFQWGEADCILAMCNWVAERTGVDPALPWRGCYSDEEGAARIMAAHGGLLGLVRHGMAATGFKEAAPAPGLPVVAALGGHEVAGVCTGPRIAFLAQGRGMIETRAPVLMAWAI
jgi:Domain of unknown function (DUF6950)